MIDVTCLASGGGRTILNLLDEIEAGRLDADISAVLVSRPDAPAIERCQARGLTVESPSHSDVDRWIVDRLDALRPSLTCLCGYLRLLPMQPWMTDRVINIHPALLPSFGGRGMHGLHVHRAVLAAGESQSGCTVHFVDDVYDNGRTILQRTCPVLPNDSAESLAARVFEEECIALPEAVGLFSRSAIRVENNRVVIDA